MSTYETKKNRFLGETPTHIPKEKIVDYFLYTFEFTWTAPAFDLVRDSLPNHFQSLLEEVKAKAKQPLTIGQEWWTLVLLTLKGLSDAEKFTYSSETIQFVLNCVHTLTDEELIDYANSINNAFYDEMPDVLVLRPLEIEKNQSDASKDDKVLGYFLDREEEFLNVFQTYLKESDIDSVYINQLLVNGNKLNYQFTDFWHTYYEIFVGFSVSMYDMVIQSEKNKEEELEQLLKEVNLVFVLASVKTNSKIDNLVNKLIEMITPLYVEGLKE